MRSTTRSSRRRALARILLPGLLALGAACDPDPLSHVEAPRWSLLAVGDLGAPPHEDRRGVHLAVGAGMAAVHRERPADAVALLGDNFYPDGLKREELAFRVRENVVRPLCGFLRLDGPRSAEVADACPVPAAGRRPVPLHVVLGNHDHRSKQSRDLQRDAVPRFVPGWRLMAEHAGVVETGAGVSLVLLDSQKLYHRPEERMGAFARALAASRGPWRVVVAHHPPVLLTGASSEEEREWSENAIAHVQRVLRESGVRVHVWLSGHEHSLQLVPGRPGEPALTAIAGTGSEPRSPDVRSGTLYASRSPGFVRVDLAETADGERLVVTLYEVEPEAAGAAPAARARARVDLRGGVVPGARRRRDGI